MIGRSPWSLLLFVIQQPNSAALTYSRATPKLSGSSTSVAVPAATRVEGGATRLQQLRPGVTPWVNDYIYQEKLQSQTRKAEASEEDNYAAITALSLAMECVGPLAVAVAFAVVGTFTLAGEPSLASFLASPTISQLVGGAWVASEATFYLCCIATATFYTASAGHAPGSRGDVTEWDAEGRAEVWRRIVKDPSIDVRELLEGWMYRTDVKQASSLDLLTDWAAARLGLPAAGADARPSREAVAAAGVAYSELSVGDVCAWLVGCMFASSREALSPEQDAELQRMVRELEMAAGSPLAGSSLLEGAPSASFATTPGIGSMCAQTGAVQWRARPLAYYAVSHGIGEKVYTQHTMAGFGFERQREGELNYWYRPAKAGAAASDALVFVHGIGLGPAPYASFLDQCADDSTPLIALDIDAFSQRIFAAAPPTPDRFAALLDAALARHGVQRAVMAGHSLGSTYVAQFARRDRARGDARRVVGVVLLDPVACLLHQAKTTSEFVFNSLYNLEDATMDYIFKKELWSAIMVSRHLAWHEGEWWLDDCTKQVPTLVTVGAKDMIVAPERVRAAFGSWQARLRGVRLQYLPCGHGSWLADPELNAELVSSVRALRRDVATRRR